MNEIRNTLGRMRELAVQSTSDTVNDNDHNSIDLEFEQLNSRHLQVGLIFDPGPALVVVCQWRMVCKHHANTHCFRLCLGVQ